jgi:hypothetical protein
VAAPGQRCGESLQLRDREGLETLVGLRDFELHAIAFIEGLEPFSANDGEVDENILSTFILRDEAEAFLVIKPFDGSLGHAKCSLSFIDYDRLLLTRNEKIVTGI